MYAAEDVPGHGSRSRRWPRTSACRRTSGTVTSPTAPAGSRSLSTGIAERRGRRARRVGHPAPTASRRLRRGRGAAAGWSGLMAAGDRCGQRGRASSQTSSKERTPECGGGRSLRAASATDELGLRRADGDLFAVAKPPQRRCRSREVQVDCSGHPALQPRLAALCILDFKARLKPHGATTSATGWPAPTSPTTTG